MDEPRSCHCFASQISTAPFWHAVSEAGSPQLCPNQPSPQADAGLPQCPQLTIQAPSLILNDCDVFILSLCWCLPPGIRWVSQFFCLWKLGRSAWGLLPLGLPSGCWGTQLHCRGGCTGLPGADPLCLKRPSTGSGSSAQLSLTEPPAQLAWATPCAAEPQAEPRLAGSYIPAIAKICPTRHRTQSSTWILASPLFPDSAFLLPEVLHQSS